jgi:hypothetical protein
MRNNSEHRDLSMRNHHLTKKPEHFNPVSFFPGSKFSNGTEGFPDQNRNSAPGFDRSSGTQTTTVRKRGLAGREATIAGRDETTDTLSTGSGRLGSEGAAKSS